VKRTLGIAAMLGAAAFGPGCATPVPPGEWKHVREQPLETSELHEACVKLQRGDRLEYAFVARRPVDFDIHYHEGKAVVAPVTRQKVERDEDAFEPLDAHEYCMTWQSPPPGTLLDYRYRVIRGAKRSRP